MPWPSSWRLVEIIHHPRGEWIVVVPHAGDLFLYQDTGKVTGLISLELTLWLRRAIGMRVWDYSNTSEERPWYGRVWQINTSYAFFFHTKKQARLFVLRWT